MKRAAPATWGAFVLFGFVIVLAACTSSGETVDTTTTVTRASTPPPPTLSTVTTTSTGPSTTIQSSVPATGSALASTYGQDGPVPVAADGFHGSGCTAEGSTLGDGIWFGHLFEYGVGPNTQSVVFDLACRGDGETGYTLTNNSARTRELVVRTTTRFVLDGNRDKPQVLTLGKDHLAISEYLGAYAGAGWGWGLIDGGVLSEFLVVTNHYEYGTGRLEELGATIPGFIYSDSGLITGPDGFDGSGCHPQTEAHLSDGVWHGRVSLVGPGLLEIDISCQTSDPQKWDELGLDATFIEDRAWIDDGSDVVYTVGLDPEARWLMTNVDLQRFQTELRSDDPRLHHLLASPFGAAAWIRIDNGEVVEVYQFFEA